MADVVSSNGLRILGYLVLAGLALVARHRERTRATVADGAWPMFWWSTAVFLVALAMARLGDIGSLLSELGRGRAVDSGWYDTRRPVQTLVVAVVGAAWLLTVSVACWRTPERRRRYLPVGLLVITLAAYGAIRVVSLHQIDSLLYRDRIAGVRIATLIEVGLQTLTGIATAWVPIGEGAAAAAAEADRSAAAH